jgi:hypothetical protein|tara:strand:+ start:14750 stop:14908 length:159 start_codon:yes stop_codon:yes gene_type:complete
MDKIKTALSSPLFKAACCLGVGLVLIAEKHPMYAGMCFGFGIREFLLAFRSI